MLWIGEAESDKLCIIREIELKTGLKATIDDGLTSHRRSDVSRFQVIVVSLPASERLVRETLEAVQQAPTAVPVVVFDRGHLLDESLIRPPMTLFQYVTNGSPDQLAAQIRMAMASNRQTSSRASSDEILSKWLIGDSQPMRELRALVRLVAPRQSTVLISGETGSGKERVVRAIHAIGNRSTAELVAVNCGALPESLIEAELFGHTKGAFTGAVNARPGRFEQAHKSTLYLDEIGEIPMPLQARLLRVLQERELQRVGSSETIKIDTRIIAATNVNLLEAVSQKRFREDLYYRLNVVPIYVPALRERREDIPLLAEHFVEQVCQREALPIKQLSPKAMQRLIDYAWPGNVRQLEHVIETAVALSGQRTHLFLGDIDLPDPIRVVEPGEMSLVDSSSIEIPSSGVCFEDIIGRVEKLLLEQALRSCGNNKAKAASLLGMKRTTLLYKMKALEGFAA
jgi:DNA-binding NtrC family response regulator